MISLATGILFGLSPALRSTRPDLAAALKDDGAAFGMQLSRSRFRSLLLGVQVAVSMMLLVTAGLLARGLLRSESADPGFETRQTFALSVPASLADRLAGEPEVRASQWGACP